LGKSSQELPPPSVSPEFVYVYASIYDPILQAKNIEVDSKYWNIAK
jgi:hypothetical protein